MSQLCCYRFLIKSVLLLALVAKAKGCLLAKKKKVPKQLCCHELRLRTGRLRRPSEDRKMIWKINSQAHMLWTGECAPSPSGSLSAFSLSPTTTTTTYQTCLQHSGAHRCRNNAVAEEEKKNSQSCSWLTRDPGGITATLTSDPIQLKQMAAFQIPLPPLRRVVVLLSAFGTPPLRTGALSVAFLPPPRCCFFPPNERNRETAPEANASLRSPPPHSHPTLHAFCFNFIIHCIVGEFS